MDNVSYVIQNGSLMHYASKYYDPEKAHQYYEENKQLKGRHSSATLNDTGKEIWGYTKGQISNEKKTKSQELSYNYKSKVAQYRAYAAEAKERISSELKTKLNSISDTAEKQKLALSVKSAIEKTRVGIASGQLKKSASTTAGNRIEQLQNMANNANTEDKLRIQKQIDEIRSDRDNKISDVKENAADERDDIEESYGSSKDEITKTANDKKFNARLEAASNKEQVRNTMQESIANARAEYDKAKSDMKTIYEQLFDDEYEKIHSEYGTDVQMGVDPELQTKAQAHAEARRKALREKWNAKN